jgi:hypothetical protein
MKSVAKIHASILENDSHVLAELRRLFPFARDDSSFEVSLALDDPRLQAVLQTLGDKKLVCRKLGTPRIKGGYTYELRRRYETGDFDAPDYLQVKHEVLISDDSERDNQGRLVLEAWRLMPALRMGCMLFNTTIVSDEIRRLMEAERLVGIAFKELVLTPSAETRTLADDKGRIFREVTPEDQDHIEKQGRYWELTSSVLLPPMPADRVVRHFPDDDMHVAGIRDGDYFDKEIHYASAIRKIKPFDFALTHEIFGAKSWQQFPGERWPVVSQRFRQFCMAHRLKVSWVPVRLDPATES